MMTAKKLSILLALAAAATGCAAEAPDAGGEDGGGGGNGGGGGEDFTPMTADGTYSVRSKFDLATNAPGAVGDVVNVIIDATDSGDDPANWLLEQMINQLPSGAVKTALNGARPFVAGYLNDQLLSYAPDFVGTMVQIGNDFGQLAKNFGTNETLVVTGTASPYTAVKTVTGAHFKIDSVETDIAFADYNMANVVVPGVGITVSPTSQFGIGQHTVPLSYGKILHIGLDAAIIPMIDSSASNLGELFQGLVDCNEVGYLIASQIGGFGAGALTTACNAGLVVGANYIYSKIDGIDGSAMEFGLTGTARAIDKNNDRKLDTLQTGTWAGDLSYAGTPAPLTGSTFYGERM